MFHLCAKDGAFPAGKDEVGHLVHVRAARELARAPGLLQARDDLLLPEVEDFLEAAAEGLVLVRELLAQVADEAAALALVAADLHEAMLEVIPQALERGVRLVEEPRAQVLEHLA